MDHNSTLTLKRLNELPILERLQLRDLFISNLLSETQEQQQTIEEEEIDLATIDPPDPVTKEIYWQIIEMAKGDKALEICPWLTKESLARLRARIAENRANEKW